MIRSMTAFAACERAATGGQLACELRAVNHRFHELVVRTPEGPWYTRRMMSALAASRCWGVSTRRAWLSANSARVPRYERDRSRRTSALQAGFRVPLHEWGQGTTENGWVRIRLSGTLFLAEERSLA